MVKVMQMCNKFGICSISEGMEKGQTQVPNMVFVREEFKKYHT